MCKPDKYRYFIDRLIDNSPEFMVIKEEEENYLLLDRFILGLSDKAMPWLFKVYLDKNYNLLRNDTFTHEIKKKYIELDLKLLNVNGNLFLNRDGLYVILRELDLFDQVEYDKNTLQFTLK